jgi:hypothetical protein
MNDVNSLPGIFEPEQPRTLIFITQLVGKSFGSRLEQGNRSFSRHYIQKQQQNQRVFDR